MRFHTNLPVQDLQSTVQFYTELFQTAPVKQRADYAKFLALDGKLNISFHVQPDAVGALRPLHLGLELPDKAALDAMYTRLQQAGLAQQRETSVCCYANQDKFWITDPNGYRWELYQLLEDTTEKFSPKQTCCAPQPSAEGAADAPPACC